LLLLYYCLVCCYVYCRLRGYERWRPGWTRAFTSRVIWSWEARAIPDYVIYTRDRGFFKGTIVRRWFSFGSLRWKILLQGFHWLLWPCKFLRKVLNRFKLLWCGKILVLWKLTLNHFSKSVLSGSLMSISCIVNAFIEISILH
jgi:hypothetical protein